MLCSFKNINQKYNLTLTFTVQGQMFTRSNIFIYIRLYIEIIHLCCVILKILNITFEHPMYNAKRIHPIKFIALLIQLKYTPSKIAYNTNFLNLDGDFTY